jgi:hypothetical protein
LKGRLRIERRGGNLSPMSKAEILAELPKLRPEERDQVFQRLCELQEGDILEGNPPDFAERKLLDEALVEFQRDGDPGTPWRTVLQRLRSNHTP